MSQPAEMSMGKENMVTGDAEVTRCAGIPSFQGRDM